MAKYKGREVHVLEELPHGAVDMVKIEHRELLGAGVEIVPKNLVVLNKDEKKSIDDARKERAKEYNENDFQIEGMEKKLDFIPTRVEVLQEKLAEVNAKVHDKAEDVRHKVEARVKK